MPAKTHSYSTLDMPTEVSSPTKLISSKRTLILPLVFDGDKYEVQIVRLNGLHTVNLIKYLLDLVNKLSEDVTHLKSDNASLKSQLTELQQSVDTQLISKLILLQVHTSASF
jgi:uncharacterized membrane protein YjjP (DUF1212 family)